MADTALAFASPAEALRVAVERVGSQSAMGRLVGVKQPSVHRWLDRGKVLPAQHVLTVERATGISRHDLRPDLYPEEQDAAVDDDGSLFARFGGVGQMAELVGVPLAEVLRWREERQIPRSHIPAVLDAAEARSLDVSAEDVIFPFPEDRAVR